MVGHAMQLEPCWVVRLPFSSIREEFIIAQTQEHLLYSGSKGATVSRAGIIMRTGRKQDREEAEGS